MYDFFEFHFSTEGLKNFASNLGHLAGGDAQDARSAALVVFDSEPSLVVNLWVGDYDYSVAEIQRLSGICFKEYQSN